MTTARETLQAIIDYATREQMQETRELLALHRNEVLEEVATALEGIHAAVYDDIGQRAANGVLRSVQHVRSMTTPKES